MSQTWQSDRRQTGKTGEAQALQYLRDQHYDIVATNFHASHFGEIDIIAQDGETLVFVEVRTRQTHSGGSPQESVDEIKLGRMIRAAEYYLMKHPGDFPWRIDVLALQLNPDGTLAALKHFDNVSMD